MATVFIGQTSMTTSKQKECSRAFRRTSEKSPGHSPASQQGIAVDEPRAAQGEIAKAFTRGSRLSAGH